MWFDNKSREEIRERLLKEGIFAKLLDEAELDQEHLERAQQEALTREEAIDLLESATKHILLPRLSGITTPKNVEKQEYRYFRAEAVGEALLELLAQAESSIYVTHFAVEQYSELYIALQLEKVNQGLVFERIVYFHSEYLHSYAWLDRFYDKDKNHAPIKRYQQYKLTSNRPPLPYDLMIIDEKYAILVHRVPVTDPVSPLLLSDEVAFFQNDMMVTYFLDIWKSLKPQEDQKRGRTTWVNKVVPDDPHERISKRQIIPDRKYRRANLLNSEYEG